MSKQVNVRLSDFHVQLLNSMKDAHEDLGVKSSQARVIEEALELWVKSEPNMMAAGSEKMNLGFYFSDK